MRYTLLRDHVLPTDPFFHTVAAYGPLAPAVDLRPWAGPDVRQPYNDCTGEAIRHFREWWSIRFNEPYVALSPLFVYNEERLREHTLNQDGGARPRDGAWCLTTLGICPWNVWPTTPANLFEPPSAEAVSAALPYKLDTAYRLAGLTDILHCLSQGYPAIIGMGITAEWETPQTLATGQVPIPPPQSPLLGGHEVLAIGYHLAQQYVIIQNSWGPVGVDGSGYFYVPFTYLNEYLWSAWTFRNTNSPATLPLVRELPSNPPVAPTPKKKTPKPKTA